MNRDIIFMEIDPDLSARAAAAILEKLPPSGGRDALVSAFMDLSSGRARSVVMENSGKAAGAPGTIVAGKLEINLKSRRVTLGGREISLTPKEFDILYFLAENKGEVFTKEQIYNAVWSDGYFLDDSNIMAFIRKLRKKIEPDPDLPRYILTIWGIGYKFNDSI